jgi:hypothetical protein
MRNKLNKISSSGEKQNFCIQNKKIEEIDTVKP